MVLARFLSVGLFAVGASTQCEFEVTPATPFTWSESCRADVPGCKADGKNMQCRFCGQKPLLPCHIEGKVPPPGSSFCNFTVPPTQSYTWDDTCNGGKSGCSADGHNLYCRFCGDAPFLPCPDTHTGDQCTFDWTPDYHVTYDKTCHEGKKGCKADGKHMRCKFCGGPYDPCPSCEFDVEPNKPYTWDSSCLSEKYMHGCKADGKNFGCRFCGRGYEPCPTTTATSTTETMTTTTTFSTTSTQTTTSVTTTRALRLRGNGARPWLAASVQCAITLCLMAVISLH